VEERTRQDFADFVAARSTELLRLAYVLTGDQHAAEDLLQTAQHHDHYEKTHAPHNWWDWYSAYMGAREHGSTPDEAVQAANRYMDEVLHIAAL
jgi:hypothetical protein